MPITVNIGQDQFDFFNNAVINLTYGQATSSFKLSGLYDPRSAVYRRVFKPLDFKSITIDTGRGERLINGVVLGTGFDEQARKRFSTLSGYNKVGVLQESTIPIGTPYQYNGETLENIANTIASKFGITVVVENDGGLASQVIDEETARPTETVIQFLSRIAAQRNLVITSTTNGELKITRTNVNRPSIATYREGTPSVKISHVSNGQRMHSDITVMQQADLDTDNVAQETINNPLVNSFRPITRVQTSGTNADTQTAAQNIRANELRNIAITIESDRWEWLNNGARETILPDNIVTIISPSNYIYQPTNFFVERVQLTLDQKKETAVLFCVLPEVYNGQEPKNIFG